MHQRRPREAEAERDAPADPAAVASEGDRRSGSEVEPPEVARSSRVLGGWRSGGSGRRSVAVALLSTVVFFGVIALAVTQSANWPEVKSVFFSWDEFRAAWPEIARAFLLNVKIFCIAEVLILIFALLLAVIRSL